MLCTSVLVANFATRCHVLAAGGGKVQPEGHPSVLPIHLERVLRRVLLAAFPVTHRHGKGGGVKSCGSHLHAWPYFHCPAMATLQNMVTPLVYHLRMSGQFCGGIKWAAVLQSACLQLDSSCILVLGG